MMKKYDTLTFGSKSSNAGQSNPEKARSHSPLHLHHHHTGANPLHTRTWSRRQMLIEFLANCSCAKPLMQTRLLFCFFLHTRAMTSQGGRVRTQCQKKKKSTAVIVFSRVGAYLLWLLILTSQLYWCKFFFSLLPRLPDTECFTL